MRESDASRRMALTALLGSGLAAQVTTDGGTLLTDGSANGRMWAIWSDGDKVECASTFSGSAALFVYWAKQILTQEHAEDLLLVVYHTSFSAPKFTLGDIAKETTKLYTDEPANVILPVTEMLTAACQILNGVDRSSVMKHVERRRLFWINDKDK